MAWALSGSGGRGLARSLAGAAASSAGDCGRDRRALPCGTPGASDLGTFEGARLSRAAGAGDRLAGGEHDRPLVRSRRPDGKAQAASPQSALERAFCPMRRGQRRVVHRLQGLVYDRRRRPLRAADAHRRAQPLSVALSGAGAERRRACLAGARCRIPRVRPAAQASLRQRPAVCLLRRRRAVAASVLVVKAGVEPERIAPGKPQQNGRHERMHLPVGHRQSAGAQPARAARAVARLSTPLQRRAPAPGARQCHAGRILSSLAPALGRRPARAGLWRPRGPARASNGEIKWQGISSTSIARSPASRSASPKTPPAGRSAMAPSCSA